jgi:hypothetical protein
VKYPVEVVWTEPAVDDLNRLDNRTIDRIVVSHCTRYHGCMLRLCRMVAAIVIALLCLTPVQASQSPTGVVTGVLWLDQDEHGVRQPGDPVLSDVRVESYQSVEPGGPGRLSSRVQTDSAGRFQFELRAGSTYILQAIFDDGTGDAHSIPPRVSHAGCALTAILQPGSTQQVDVRLVPRTGGPHLLSLALADGYFFKQATIRPELEVGCDSGFAVTNADGIPFWDTFRRWGPEHLGWPMSVRFEHEGQWLQIFERAVLVWRPEERRVALLNVMDEWSSRGRDERFWEAGMVPRPLNWEGGADDPEVIARRLALLDTSPAIRERYFAVDDPIALYGLPTSAAEILYPSRRFEMDETEGAASAIALRTQKTVFYFWLLDTPSILQPFAAGHAEEVTSAQNGRYLRSQGWYPRDVFVRQPVPIGAGTNRPVW